LLNIYYFLLPEIVRNVVNDDSEEDVYEEEIANDRSEGHLETNCQKESEINGQHNYQGSESVLPEYYVQCY
jgi:hypothetical protein